MEKKTRRLTNIYSGVAATAAFITQPVPALDELIVVPIHYWFSLRFARKRGASILKLPWGSIQRIIWYGAAARLVGNFSLGLVPVVGMFSNAITAIALTEYLAWWLDEYLNHPDSPPPEITMDGLKELFAKAVQKKQKQDAEQQAPQEQTTQP